MLTIAPKLLDELAADTSTRVEAQLSADQTSEDPREIPDEARFRAELNDDAMATEKLADGIRRFAADQAKLDSWLASLA